jgi:hypothetical protein
MAKIQPSLRDFDNLQIGSPTLKGWARVASPFGRSFRVAGFWEMTDPWAERCDPFLIVPIMCSVFLIGREQKPKGLGLGT